MKNLNSEDLFALYKFDTTKIIISLILVVFALAFPKVGFLPLGCEGFSLKANILFPLCHANIFHLLCNLLCLFMMRRPYYLVEGIIISFLCSLLPEWTDTPIMGCSGILFAIIGIKYGRLDRWKELLKNTWLFFIITAFIPNVACLFHIYCILCGYIVGTLQTTFILWQKTRKMLR